MKEENKKPIDIVKYSHFKKCLKSLERDFKGQPKVLDNIDISFEYVIGSLFPNILSNIQNEMSNQYIKGFTDRINIGKIDSKLYKYTIDDMKNIINSIDSIIRDDNTTIEDKEKLKQVIEILKDIIKNTN